MDIQDAFDDDYAESTIDAFSTPEGIAPNPEPAAPISFDALALDTYTSPR